MALLKLPEVNSVCVAGNLTKDPTYNTTNKNASVVNFHIAVNRSYKTSDNKRKEDVCYVGVVAWNKLADSCKQHLRKGSPVMVEGMLQSKTFEIEESPNLTIVEIKAKKIQFLNKLSEEEENAHQLSAETTLG